LPEEASSLVDVYPLAGVAPPFFPFSLAAHAFPVQILYVDLAGEFLPFLETLLIGILFFRYFRKTSPLLSTGSLVPEDNYNISI
jgi:hypothetical protein